MSDTAWLIEGGDGYWTGRTMWELDRDQNEACRFARQADAERVRLWLILSEGMAGKVFASALKSTEHVWMDQTS